MSPRWHISLALILLVGGVFFAAAVAAAGARTEEVLSWDDGEYSHWSHAVSGRVGQQAAVMFQAPEWANWVTEIHFFIMDDHLENPDDPLLPTTLPFLAYVWTPSDGTPVLPDVAVNEGVNSGELYPEDAWLHVVLPEPVNIADGTQFPGRVFFVGPEWLNRLNPCVGYDITPPIDQFSWFFNWSFWELQEDRDFMIRAVVTDSWVSPVESLTWAAIKSMYR